MAMSATRSVSFLDATEEKSPGIKDVIQRTVVSETGAASGQDILDLLFGLAFQIRTDLEATRRSR